MEKDFEIIPISKFLKERNIKRVIVYSRENDKVGVVDLTKDENYYDSLEFNSREGLINITLDSEDVPKDEEIFFYRGYAIIINKNKDNLLVRLKILKYFQNSNTEWSRENKVDTWLFLKLVPGKISENILKKIVKSQDEEWTYLKI